MLTDPARHLPSVKSIIAGLFYAGKRIDKEEEQFISCTGKGYHQVMQAKMQELIIFEITIKRYRVKAYSDTGAYWIEVAYQAGLGWIGKSNNLINPEYGSYLFWGS